MRSRILRSSLAMAVPTLLPGALAQAQASPRSMQKRRIPSSGEMLPVIGCGTYIGFDVAPGSSAYQALGGILRPLFDAGGSLFDSSPMYGRAEQTTGELLAASGERPRAFLATKVWTTGKQAGIEQIERSMSLLQSPTIDLLQIHNLQDWRTHLSTLRELKQRGVIRYIGITHYTSAAYDDVARIMKGEAIDFVQINYSLGEREAERTIIPLAAERGIALIANRPFGGGNLFGGLRSKPLPPWAKEIGASSWAQVLLKFVLADPAMTCAIPGTARVQHMVDNVGAGMGEIPPPAFWAQPAHRIEL
ncbi:aldo/keto reductase [Herbaspirillum sp. YR522]|uniref:aldo/keto reductase n=1 Tax=Herbaspirillum sp. YR522 TaxID=1144342 RepID=UPI000685F4A8